MEITLEEIQKKFDSLPEDLKWAIMAANVDDNIIDIGQKEGLNVEQMGQLSLETHMVMFGFTHPDKFEESVKKSMGLGDEKTRAIANAVNEKILKEIKGKMMEVFQTVPKTETILPKETVEDTHIEDKKVLNSHGIKIIPEKLELTTSEKNKEEINTILAQKLSGPVQNKMTKTEHTLDNLSKPQNIPIKPEIPIAPSSVMGSIKPMSGDTAKLSPSYGKGMDPYRVKPE